MTNQLKSGGYHLLEAVVLFVGIPLLFYWNLVPVPKLVALLLVALFCGYILWKDEALSSTLFSGSSTGGITKSILLRFVAAGLLLAILVWIVYPRQFLELPLQRPVIWGAVMVLYPLLSVLPQEFIYRSFFFHRYSRYLPGRYGAIIASALVFSFLHIVYDNWWAVGLSFLGGLLFSITYARTRSLFWVTVEHLL